MKVLWAITLVASLIFVIQSIATFLGADSDAIDSDIDFDGGDSQVPDAIDGGHGMNLLTFRNLVNFCLGFGWTAVLLQGDGPTGLVMTVAVLVGVGLVILGSSFEKRSQEALELTAQLEALRRWLKDFTRLEEAVPRDVVLWNRLLIMAVVLGVADEVIKQLRMVAPELLNDVALASTYGWYYGHGPSMPMRSFSEAAAAAHSVSTAALSSSSDSGGGGGGGGFSGGGGGGFGGGGGGGAF